ncbi:MAG: hypothetical protein HY434_01645 [Candidatus Liptonbacteria bacterium]|nr:hypothetical protein [Candidatus Liptonbacteria bacterium]
MPRQLVRPESVRGYQEMFREVYGPANERYPDSDLFLRLIEEIASVMEVVRKDDLHELPVQLARVYAWWNAVANRIKIDLQEALWLKYPGVCSYCLRTENCFCAVEHPNVPRREDILRRLRRERGHEPQSLKGHQELHQRLYGRQNRRILAIQTASHLAEEAGEISREFRHRGVEGLQDEMADVGSWIFALANRCGFDIADAVWELYPYECETCHVFVCSCK